MNRMFGKFLRESPEGEFTYWCPGCETSHGFSGKTSKRTHPWDFDYDPVHPTVSPSLGTNMGDPKRQCHAYMEAGRLRFLADCVHALANQTVDMVPYPYADQCTDPPTEVA